MIGYLRSIIVDREKTKNKAPDHIKRKRKNGRKSDAKIAAKNKVVLKKQKNGEELDVADKKRLQSIENEKIWWHSIPTKKPKAETVLELAKKKIEFDKTGDLEETKKWIYEIWTTKPRSTRYSTFQRFDEKSAQQTALYEQSARRKGKRKLSRALNPESTKRAQMKFREAHPTTLEEKAVNALQARENRRIDKIIAQVNIDKEIPQEFWPKLQKKQQRSNIEEWIEKVTKQNHKFNPLNIEDGLNDELQCSLALFLRRCFESKCFYCGGDEKMTLDRIDNDLNYKLHNVVPACSGCNMSKNVHPVKEFIEHSMAVSAHQLVHPFEAQTGRKDVTMCGYCGNPSHDSVDRIVPFGQYVTENELACCKTCNFMKKDQNVHHWIERSHHIRLRFIDGFSMRMIVELMSTIVEKCFIEHKSSNEAMIVKRNSKYVGGRNSQETTVVIASSHNKVYHTPTEFTENLCLFDLQQDEKSHIELVPKQFVGQLKHEHYSLVMKNGYRPCRVCRIQLTDQELEELLNFKMPPKTEMIKKITNLNPPLEDILKLKNVEFNNDEKEEKSTLPRKNNMYIRSKDDVTECYMFHKDPFYHHDSECAYALPTPRVSFTLQSTNIPQDLIPCNACKKRLMPDEKEPNKEQIKKANKQRSANLAALKRPALRRAQKARNSMEDK